VPGDQFCTLPPRAQRTSARSLSTSTVVLLSAPSDSESDNS
jgi:hypothetical protein